MIHGPCTNCGSKNTTSYFDKSRNRTRIQWCTIDGNTVCRRCYNDHRYNLPEIVKIRKKWLEDTKERRGKWKKDYYEKMRNEALRIVARGNEIRCVNCDCDLIKILEINHINGGGTKENKNQIINDIVFKRRNVNDLDIRCRICNALHYTELTNGPLPFSISWRS